MTTQMCINRLPLNRDVQDIIKSFVFHDMKTCETINHIKNKKMEIVTMFENTRYSRNNNQLEDPNEESEHWAFCLGENENQFQATNCRMCGDYRAEYAYDYMPNHILCNCGYHEEYDEGDDYHSNQYPHYNSISSEDDTLESYDGDEPDIDRYEYFERYYNNSDLEDEFGPEQELEEQEARITRARMQYIQERQEQEEEEHIEQAIQEQKDWDSETEENPTQLMRRRQIRRMAESEGEEYYYRYFRNRHK